MRTTFLHLFGFAAALLLIVLLAASCGGAGGGDSAGTVEPLDADAGRQLFQTTCRSCHSLADAEAAGVFGPDLDLLQPDAERVREQIRDGGGGMPNNLLDGDDANLVARYVAQVAGADLAQEGKGGSRGAAKPGADG